MAKKELSIIIVSYNTKKELRVCLESIYKYVDVNFEIIVIDNASSDSSVEMIKNNFKDVILICNDKNLGFAKAVNQGFGKAKGDYYLLLNPDTEVKNGAVETLLDFTKTQSDFGVAGGKLINPDGTIQPSCYNLPTLRRAISEFWFGKKETFEKYFPETLKPVEVEAVVGAVMLIPKESIEKVGLFDERYFLYFEDLDWCRRAKNLGLKIWYHPQVKFFHQHGASGKKIPEKTNRWLIESSKKYHGIFKYYCITTIIKIGQLLFRT